MTTVQFFLALTISIKYLTRDTHSLFLSKQAQVLDFFPSLRIFGGDNGEDVRDWIQGNERN